MKKVGIIILVTLCILCCACGSGYTEPVAITYDEFTTKINNKETFTLLMWQTDCGHCESFEPKLNKVIKKYDILINSINLKDLSETEYAKLKNKTFISGTPTIVHIKDGVVQSTKLVGDKSEDNTIDFLKNYEVIK